MYARVARFKDVTQETVDSVIGEIEASDGPPPGVAATGVRMLYDACLLYTSPSPRDRS